jgi:trk system potassium uptake protein TrkH
MKKITTKLRRKHLLADLSPASALTLFFALSILVGAILLATPLASNGPSLSFVDALFTATSAQCVTGLTVVDTGTTFSLFGQLVILVLMQLGGLGITTFSVYLFIYLRTGVGLRDRWIIHETLVHTPVRSLKELVRAVIHLTLVVEAIGAACLALVFVPRFGWVQGLYHALFHAVSAFCNAGFSLFSDSLIGFRNDPVVNLTIMILIILGGLGFLVIKELLDIRQRLRSGRRWRLSLHSKLVLATSGILLMSGWVAIFLLEIGNGTFRQAPLGEVLWVTLFQSVTTRTAGFNSIDLNALGVPTIVLMMALMFIGASPGSTGGGVKTTSLAVFVATLYSRLKGYRVTSICRRTIPEETVSKTLTLFLIAGLWIGMMTFFVLLVEVSGPMAAQPHGVFLDYLFEVVSAFGTVGLSLGVTAKLTVLGKLLITLLMFVGRIGLLTFAFVVIKQAGRDGTLYAEENIMIG